MAMQEELELQEYRDLMTPPEEFVDGFDLKTVIGAFFIGFVMMPGSIYLGLVAGQTMGPAAEWVTIILFTEVARRSFLTLKRQEVYIMYYIAGSLTSMSGALALSGGPFADLIWKQFLVQSPSATRYAHLVPNWVVPSPETLATIGRTFWNKAWLPAISVIVLTNILSRLSWFGFGYTLFRITSDFEQLSFPMAPVAAMGATALAETSAKEETWRWQVFSIGSMIGIVFGAIYVGLPTISGLILVRPIHILPIPWIDFTQSTERFLPAAALGVTTSLSAILVGFVLPYWVVVGGFIAAMGTALINPVLYHFGVLHTWQPGMDTVNTVFADQIDFWLSFSIGIAFAVAVIGFYKVIVTLRERKDTPPADRARMTPPPGRGDIPISIALGLFVAATLGYIVLCKKLVPGFPIYFFVFFGFVYTPLTSYINARLIGLTGQYVDIPYLREATFIYSGYKGVDIWFAPIPMSNYGGLAQRFRELELTGTSIRSLIKAELLMFPIIMICSFLFWSYIWHLAEIPSVMYPYTQKFWDLIAMQQSIWYSSTLPGGSQLFRQVIHFPIIGLGLGIGLAFYIVFSLIGWPVMLIYGFIRGLGTMPHFILPEIIGALLGRYYFEKRFGKRTWRQYAPVLMAGFSCGMGLIGMVAVALALISQSITQLPF